MNVSERMWKTLPKDDLDKAYNNSLAVIDSAEITRAWVEESKEARDFLDGSLEISYGPGKFQSYDYFHAGANAPVIAFIHGGFWQNRSKNDFSFIAPAFVRSGISVAILGYTLAPHAKMDGIVSDVRTAIESLSNKLKSSYESNSTIWLVGWSAGAQLITMSLDTPSVLGGTAISGIYDLEPIIHCYINDKLCLDQDSAIRNSPIYLKNHFGKTLDLFVGDHELPEMIQQTSEFSTYRKLNDQFGDTCFLNGYNHFSIFDELTKPNGKIFSSIVNRIG